VTSDVDPAAPDPPAGPEVDPDGTGEETSLFAAAAEPPPSTPARPTKRAAGAAQGARRTTGAPTKRPSAPRAPAKKAARAASSRRAATDSPAPPEPPPDGDAATAPAGPELSAPPADVAVETDAVEAASLDQDGDEAETPARRGPATWPDRAVVVVAVLLVMVVVLVLGVVGTGLGAPAKQASAGARLGAAFVGQVGTADSLALVVAAVVLAWAAQAGAARRAVVVLRWALLLSAIALLVFAPFAVWGDVSYLHRTHQVVDLVTKRQLATYLAVTMIPDALAAVLAWWVRTSQGGPAWVPTTTLP
jgi:hypothetical protein